MRKNEGLPISIQTRLHNHARKLGLNYNLLLERYALERYLYRLSKSPYAERFVLKGALLMLVWLGETVRPTRDADLLGFGNMDKTTLQNIFQEVCAIEVDPDGMEYQPDSITVADIRENDPYGGRRIKLRSLLGIVRLSLQVDVGIGDNVTPEPIWLDYPSLLQMPSARLRAYQPETAIAERFHAMVVLGQANSRMKDFLTSRHWQPMNTSTETS
jgi:Nucleotidyl transferase AbiEii toxin, Type IV TA system